MSQCPKCGATNPRGSRFCNECGESLPMHTALRCPMCGAMNPVGNVYCDKCNARLVPMAAPPAQEEAPKPIPIKGFSLPTILPEEQPVTDATAEIEMKGESEDWLSQLRASTTEETEEPEPEVESIESGEGAEDWLSQLRVSAEENEGAEPISEPVEPVEIPDWLRDMGPVSGEGEPTPSPVEEQPTIVESVEREPEAKAPDWLRDIAPEEEATAPEAAPPLAEAQVEEPAPALAGRGSRLAARHRAGGGGNSARGRAPAGRAPSRGTSSRPGRGSPSLKLQNGWPNSSQRPRLLVRRRPQFLRNLFYHNPRLKQPRRRAWRGQRSLPGWRLRARRKQQQG
ncbi:MAG: hypothetical protein B6I35_01715 [Anaerolineaceae bacterium 4572_32.2]|nr:MAG: hypothetical protein B6I35_01715 [Anaerolineaceae bacterium 4572_32.2]